MMIKSPAVLWDFFFYNIFSMTKRILIQGVDGCFHDAAARSYFEGEEVEIIPCDTFNSMFEYLEQDSSLMAVMAIENTIAGSLLQNHELLRKSNTKVIGEYKMRISHVIAALENQKLQDLSEVNSHPMALMQCEEFLLQHKNLKMVEKSDTAGSAKEIAEKQLLGHAAICGEFAANLYGLNILQKGIETNKRNFTRFLVLADNSYEEYCNNKIDKASLVFTLPHTNGSLAKILTIFSFYDLNLSKIQSIPLIGREWEYRFFVNLTFNDYTRYRQSIEAVKPLISEFKILGEYSKFSNDESK